MFDHGAETGAGGHQQVDRGGKDGQDAQRQQNGTEVGDKIAGRCIGHEERRDGDEQQQHAGSSKGAGPNRLLGCHGDDVVAHREHERQRHPAVGHTLGQPHHLSRVGQFAEEHVEHGQDVSSDAHDEEPYARLEFLLAAVRSGDEDVDEHRNQQQTNSEGFQTVEHGSNRIFRGVDVEEAEDERQDVGGEEHDRQKQGDHGSVGFAGQATVAVSCSSDHAAAHQPVQQGDGEEVQRCILERRAVIV